MCSLGICIYSVCSNCRCSGMRISIKFIRGYPTLTTHFFIIIIIQLMRRKRGPKTTKTGHHRPSSDTPFKWRFAGGPIVVQNTDCWLGSFVIFQGIRTSFAKKPYSFVIFQGERGSRSAHVWQGHGNTQVRLNLPWPHVDRYTDSLVVLWLSVSTRCQFTWGVDAGNNQRHWQW